MASALPRDVVLGIQALVRRGMTDRQISLFLDGAMTPSAVYWARRKYSIASRYKSDPYAEWAAVREVTP